MYKEENVHLYFFLGVNVNFRRVVINDFDSRPKGAEACFKYICKTYPSDVDFCYILDARDSNGYKAIAIISIYNNSTGSATSLPNYGGALMIGPSGLQSWKIYNYVLS